LFTNDEAIVKKFTSSKTGVPRLFHIELETNLKLGDLKKIQAGLYIDDKTVSVDEISYVEGKDKNQIGLKLRNIGNSTIRSIFEHLGYEIVTLDCVAIGELTKKDLPRGRWRHLSQQEVNNLKMLA
ncbi:MAG TPA: rRNA pseudouridine synthase, partial [Aquaticitalea sp.]|nr:rRNA pseudouridine synthase [Aquaticitalea sp.]